MDVSQKNNITRVLTQQVIPRLLENRTDRIVVARSSFKAFGSRGDLPLGMSVTRRPLQSQGVKVRGKQFFGKMLVNARWPKDGLHSLRTPKLAVVVKGNITFQCGDALLHCEPGHVIFIPPNVPHPDGSHNYLEETATPRGNCDVLFMGIHAEGVVLWLSTTAQGEHRSNGVYRIFRKQVERYLDLLWEEAVATAKYSSHNSNALLLLLMTSVYHDLREQQPIQAVQESVVVPDENNMARAKEYIHNHIHEKLTIDEVARHVYLSRTQFTGQFRRETGQSFHEYLSDCRFEIAKTLLASPLNLPVNRISQRVGLTPGMLRKLFYQKLQMTPSQFRGSQQKDQ